MIRLGRANVSFSIPLTTLRTGTPGGSRSAIAVERRPQVGRGDGDDDQVGRGRGVAGVGRDADVLGQARRRAGAGRSRAVRASSAARRGSRAQSWTDRAVLANSTARAVPIPPAPRIAIRFMVRNAVPTRLDVPNRRGPS